MVCKMIVDSKKLINLGKELKNRVESRASQDRRYYTAKSQAASSTSQSSTLHKTKLVEGATLVSQQLYTE